MNDISKITNNLAGTTQSSPHEAKSLTEVGTENQWAREPVEQLSLGSSRKHQGLLLKANSYHGHHPNRNHRHAFQEVGRHVSSGVSAGAGHFVSLASLIHGQSDQFVDLKEIARFAMMDRGLSPDFSKESLKELEGIKAPAVDTGVRDLRSLLWASIDNDDSRDLDQITVAEKLPSGDVKIRVAIADVDALVPKGSALDRQAQQNTTSVYTADKIFPMLPEKLSTNLTSLNPDEDRLAVVTEMVIGKDGAIKSEEIYRAMVRNHAKLAYPSIGTWLDGKGPMPEAMKKVEGMPEQIRIQDQVAQTLRKLRLRNGALDFESLEAKAVMQDGTVLDLRRVEKNRATELIEEFMVAANGVSARHLESHGFPVFERVLRSPEHWDEIVLLAKEYGENLPLDPDSKALEQFLEKRKAADPEDFPDLSLAVIKLMGRAEYVAERPGDEEIGHFALAAQDYSHSTAPNRRYPDLITQRLLKAAMAGKPCPYSFDELDELAYHCTEQETASDKVERSVYKSAAAMLLSPRIGEKFEAIVTGASEKGTWVRLRDLPVEGKLLKDHGVRVGKHLKVKLVEVDVAKGYIDFVPANHG